MVDLQVFNSSDLRAAGLAAKAAGTPERVERLAANLADPFAYVADLEERLPPMRRTPPFEV